MRGKAAQHKLRIGPLKDGAKEPVIVNNVRYINGARTLRRVIDGREPFLIQHNPQILKAKTAQPLHRPTMRQQHEMH